MEDSGLCALELARVLMMFAGDAMLPTRPWEKMDELRSQGACGCRLVLCEPRKEQLLAGPQKVGYVLVPVKSSRVILRPVYFTFCVVHSRKLDCACIFVFGSKKTKRRWRFSFFIRLSRTRTPDMEPGRESRPGLRIAAADSRLSY